MDHDLTTIERAFELAKTGKYLSVSAIRQRLHNEGYALAQLEGRTLARQLRDLIKGATSDA
jgi:hypothetical protein